MKHRVVSAIALALTALRCASAIVYGDQLVVLPPVSGPFSLASFYFAAGGTLELNGDMKGSSTDSLWALLCPDTSRLERSGTVCENMTFPQCEPVGFLTPQSPSLRGKATVSESGIFVAVLYSCRGSGSAFTMNATFLNPRGEQLDVRDIPLKYFYAVLAPLWISIAILWSINWVLFRRQRNGLHRSITSYPLAKLVWAAVTCAMFWVISSTGRSNRAVTIAQSILNSAVDTAYCAVLLLISRGWGIATSRLGRFRFFFAAVLAVLFAASILTDFVSAFFFSVVVIDYCIVLAFTIHSLNILIARLDFKADDFRRRQLTGTNKDELRCKMYRTFRTLLVAFYVVTMVLQVVQAFTEDTRGRWIGSVLIQALHICFFFVIMITFRLRSHNHLYRLPEEVPVNDTVVNADPQPVRVDVMEAGNAIIL